MNSAMLEDMIAHQRAEIEKLASRLSREAAERRRLAAAHWESEERFSNFARGLPVAVQFFDLMEGDRLVLAEANQAADSLLGWDHAMLLGKPLEEAFPHLRDTGAIQRYLEVVKTGRPCRFRLVLVFLENGGERLEMELHAFPLSPRRMATVYCEKRGGEEPASEQAGECLEIHLERGRRRVVMDLAPPVPPPATAAKMGAVRSRGLEGITFTDLFTLEELQTIQDAYAAATNLGSIITHPDGRPITKPSNFCRLCRDIIRRTPKGAANCVRSDAIIGRRNPAGPVMQLCLSGGLWDGGTSICVGDKHIASWLVGQVRDESVDDGHMRAYARQIGADVNEFMAALAEVPRMSRGQYVQVCNALFLFTNQMSELALQNVLQARSIVARKQAEAALRRSRARLHNLSAKLILAQEEERRQLAVELHDGIGQSLTAAKYCVDNVRQVVARGGTAKEALQSAANVLKTAINDVRRMQASLRPKMLDELGVVATLNWFCREFQSIYQDIRLQWSLEAPEVVIPAVLKPVIYRVCQEALNNAAKHSHANKVVVTLERVGRHLRLAVEDNGDGFDLPLVLEGGSWRRGLGLESMRERTELAGGSFKIETSPGLGTRVKATWRV